MPDTPRASLRLPSLVPLVALLSIPTACLEPLALDLRDPPPTDASRASDAAPTRASIGALTVRDARGGPRPPLQIPRRPRLHLAHAGVLAAAETSVLLLRGAPDDDLLADLATAPLRGDTLARAIASDVTADADALVVTPRDALEPGAPYTLAVTGWLADADGMRALGVPRAFGLRVSASPDDGAARIDSWPPDGAPAVGANLPLLATRFDGRVVGAVDAVFLADAAGVPVPAETRDVPCETLGWGGAHCVAVVPHDALVGSARYALVAGDGLRDSTGAALGRSDAWFTTAPDPDTTSPAPLPDAVCASDETALAGGCALVDDGSVTLRIRAAEAVRAFLALDDGRTRHAAGVVAPRGTASLALRGLPPDTAHRAMLRLVDAAGLEHTETFDVATSPPLATLAITEIRADARGAEPRQEYVEVVNFGAVPIDLQGFTLADRADAIGDVIPRAFLLPAGARALLVPDAFDPDDPTDDAPAPGVLLVALDGALGTGGLANTGEPLFLRDALGRRVSAAPALAAPGPGICIVRVSLDPRDGALAAFRPDALGGCTPGLPDRVAAP